MEKLESPDTPTRVGAGRHLFASPIMSRASRRSLIKGGGPPGETRASFFITSSRGGILFRWQQSCTLTCGTPSPARALSTMSLQVT